MLTPFQRFVAAYITLGDPSTSTDLPYIVLAGSAARLPFCLDADGVPCFFDGERPTGFTVASVIKRPSQGELTLAELVERDGCGVLAVVECAAIEGRATLVAHAPDRPSIVQRVRSGFASLPDLSDGTSDTFVTSKGATRATWRGDEDAWGFADASLEPVGSHLTRLVARLARVEDEALHLLDEPAVWRDTLTTRPRTGEAAGAEPFVRAWDLRSRRLQARR